MFEAKTLLILGAGASAEVGLPVGSGLLDEICSLINIGFDYSTQTRGDELIVQALKIVLDEGRDVTKLNAHLGSASQILRSAIQGISIDNIVDALEDTSVEMVAKLAIVRAIQLSEEKSHFFQKSEDHRIELNLKTFENTWYDALTKALCEKRKKSEIESIFENISIISFNYDRCIERYLPFSIANYYGLEVEVVRTLMPKLNIIRPYGVAGLLPWMGEPEEHYRSDRSIAAVKLANSARMIRTFTQGIGNPDLGQKIQQEISKSERIIFLGFAFHPQNMKILEAKVDQRTEVLATGHSASENDRAVISESILRHFGYRSDRPSSIIVAPEKCSGLFRSYWRTITAPPVRGPIKKNILRA